MKEEYKKWVLSEEISWRQKLREVFDSFFLLIKKKKKKGKKEKRSVAEGGLQKYKFSFMRQLMHIEGTVWLKDIQEEMVQVF